LLLPLLAGLGFGASRVTAGEVRVRLVAGATQVEIVDAGGKRSQVRVAGSGLEVDGRRISSGWEIADAREPYRVRTVDGSESEVRGGLLFLRSDAGIDVINKVSLEDYVAGTLGGEMYATWEPAALAAQAVACRSYVLYQQQRRRGEPHDVAADVSSQRYLGIRGESDAAWAAVRETQGRIIRFGGAPALAAFHSASGGQTASAQEVWGTPIPYLRSVPVENEEDSPDAYWRAFVSSENLEHVLNRLGFEIGTLEDLGVMRRSPSGRVSELRFRGEQGRAKVTGRQLRQALGGSTIKSTRFEVRSVSGGWVFVGSGNGHGVGMSQWAAQAMALEGAGYREILEKFYPGTSLGPRVAATRGSRLARRPAVSAARGRQFGSHKRVGEGKP